jgi:hypothetical protein
VKQVPTLLFHNEKLKDPSNVANASKDLYITITQKLNIQLRETGNAISIQEDSFPGNFPSIEIILITEAEKKE